MRVVCVTPQYPPMSLVGSWLATHEFLAGLARRRRHHVDVYRRLSSGFPYLHEGVNVHPGRDDERIVDAIAGADVVVSHLGDDGFAARTAHELGKPDVRMIHSHRADAIDVLDGCTLAVFNSETLAAQTGWTGDQVVIHPPLRTAVTATPGGHVTLVNLSQDKGGELFERLSRKLPDIPFLGVKGGYSLQLPDLIPKNYRKPNIVLRRTTPDMAAIYAQTRILLMPSAHESWGMVGVEAMHCGIPVIAHPTPGLRESLGAAGIFADRDDESAWLDAITRLQDPAEWQRASTRARARAAQLAGVAGVDRFAIEIEALVAVAA